MKWGNILLLFFLEHTVHFVSCHVTRCSALLFQRAKVSSWGLGAKTQDAKQYVVLLGVCLELCVCVSRKNELHFI